jgi:hypothetical protein
MVGSATDTVLGLYDRTHGIDLVDIEPLPMPDSADVRLQFWETFWRDHGFEGGSPTGSSRLIEVAVAQSRAGDPSELVRGLFNVLQASHSTTPALEYFVKVLWVSAREAHAVFCHTQDCLLPLPAIHLTPTQVLLILQFVGDRKLYTSVERARLQEAQANPVTHGLSFEDVFSKE